MSHRYVLVGGGMAADAAAKAIRAADPQGAVTLVTAEPDAPYRRPHLSKALWSGGAEAKAFLGTAGHGVEVMTGRAVTGIDTRAHRVTLEDGQALEYDQLLIAAGARARRLPGLPEEGPVVAYRSFADYRLARSRAGEGRRTLVVGGGFVGAELAAGLAAAGTAVHMAFPETGLGAGRFPAGLAEALTERYRARGVDVHAGTKLDAAERSGECVRVRLTDGFEAEFDLVALGVGVEPNVELARAAGLRVEDGVVVDAALRVIDDSGSPVPGVFAAGDVASFPWPRPLGRSRVEHEDAAVTMGAHAGRQMVAQARGEEPAPYEHLPFFYSDLFSDGYEAVGRLDGRLRMVEDWKRPFEEGVVYYLDGDRVVGVLLWNTWGQVDAAREVIMADQPIADESSLIGRLPA
jgi:3-phenylpropionate/trans-cinnamate dioxygenase ferredoxin reductase subunit